MKSRCPNCNKVIGRALREVSRRENFYPFCSQRCKWIDLGHWLDEDYRIASESKNEKIEAGNEAENSGQDKKKGR